MILVFLGAPGSGKGTQAKIISEQLNLKHSSTGDMLRAVSKQDTDLGKELSNILSTGELVSDELVNKIVVETLSSTEDYSGSILDGYPRTAEQAKYLDNMNLSNIYAIYFNIDINLLKIRITKRITCSNCGAIYNEELSPPSNGICENCGSTKFDKRSDDNEDSLLKRIDIFESNKNSILEYYKGKGNLIELDASKEVEEVTNQLLKTLKNRWL